MKTLYLGADHAGFALKQELAKFLAKQGYKVVDKGAHALQPQDDYPIPAYNVAKAVVANRGMGILVCGSAEGICIAANKVKGIRAIAAWTLKSAKLSRQHGDANILCLSGWELSPSHAKKIALTWLKTPFSEQERHERRINQIKQIEHGKTPK